MQHRVYTVGLQRVRPAQARTCRANDSLRPSSFLLKPVPGPSTAPTSDPSRGYLLFRELKELTGTPDPGLQERIQDLTSLLACHPSTVMQLLRQEPRLLALHREVLIDRILQLRQALPHADLEVILECKPALLLEQDVFRAVGRRRPPTM